MADVRDPNFWRRFSRAVHMDEEKQAQVLAQVLTEDERLDAEVKAGRMTQKIADLLKSTNGPRWYTLLWLFIGLLVVSCAFGVTITLVVGAANHKRQHDEWPHHGR